MDLPDSLTESIERILKGIPLEKVKKAAFSLSQSYRERKKVQSEDLIAYLATRLPATYAVQKKVLALLQTHLPHASFTSYTDFGAGPGVGLFAVSEIFTTIESARLVEIHPEMIKLASQMDFPPNIEIQFEKEITQSTDLCLFSYSLGELSNNTQEAALKSGWQATKKALVVIEPGTPAGFINILRARKLLIDLGGHLLAPCPHEEICSLKRESYPQKDDWCHFSVNVSRSFIHKYAKEGTLPYEDEKYSYLIFSKEEGIKTQARILRDPQKRSSHLHLLLCTPEGAVKKTVSKREGELYKNLRKAQWGDEI